MSPFHPPDHPIEVVKLGGDAVATPKLIVKAAHLLRDRQRSSRIVVVVSARRGVTEHLQRLVQQVDSGCGTPSRAGESADRAIASGEIVAATLIATALNNLGCSARALDAREAGLYGDGAAGRCRLRRIKVAKIRRVVAAGEVPIVAGFQVVSAGSLRTMDRGGSDITAVALAAALGALRCDFLKLSGLRCTDPRFDPDAPAVGEIDFTTLRQIIGPRSRVLHPQALSLAERYSILLRFVPFPEPGPISTVRPIVNPAV